MKPSVSKMHSKKTSCSERDSHQLQGKRILPWEWSNTWARTQKPYIHVVFQWVFMLDRERPLHPPSTQLSLTCLGTLINTGTWTPLSSMLQEACSFFQMALMPLNHLVNFQRKSPLILDSEPLLQVFSNCFVPQVLCPCLCKYPLGEKIGLLVVASF